MGLENKLKFRNIKKNIDQMYSRVFAIEPCIIYANGNLEKCYWKSRITQSYITDVDE